jgi:hypothetical protein
LFSQLLSRHLLAHLWFFLLLSFLFQGLPLDVAALCFAVSPINVPSSLTQLASALRACAAQVD